MINARVSTNAVNMHTHGKTVEFEVSDVEVSGTVVLQIITTDKKSLPDTVTVFTDREGAGKLLSAVNAYFAGIAEQQQAEARANGLGLGEGG